MSSVTVAVRGFAKSVGLLPAALLHALAPSDRSATAEVEEPATTAFA